MVRDYVMRLVEQVAKMLATFIAKRDAGQLDEARKELDAICQQHLGLTLAFAKSSSPEALAETLSAAGGVSHARAVLLSELLTHDADLSERAGRVAEASIARLHAFCLLGDALGMLSNDELATYRPKLDQLSEKLRPLAADSYVRGKLEKYRSAGAA